MGKMMHCKRCAQKHKRYKHGNGEEQNKNVEKAIKMAMKMNLWKLR